jgi:hypothetical protein
MFVVVLAIALLGATARAASESKSGPPSVLFGVEPRGETLALEERPGTTVSKFTTSGCEAPDWYSPGSPYRLHQGDVAPDPRWFAIACVSTGGDRLMLMSADGGQTEVGDGSSNLTVPLWSRRSRAVAFASGAFVCRALGNRGPVDVWVARPGGSPRRLARLGPPRGSTDARIESWAPWGTALLATVSEYDTGECRYQAHLRDTVYLVFARKRGPAMRKLVVTSGEIGHADWSPNGRMIAVTSGEGDSCQLDVYEPSGRPVRTVARFEYVPGGCYGDGLSSVWTPSGEALVFSNGTTVFRGDARSGAPREVYRALPRRRSCTPETNTCPSLRIRDVSPSGHILAKLSALEGAATVRLISPTGTASRVRERAGETALRFADR